LLWCNGVHDGVDDSAIKGNNLNWDTLVTPWMSFLFVHELPSLVGQRKNRTGNGRALSVRHNVRSPTFSAGGMVMKPHGMVKQPSRTDTLHAGWIGPPLNAPGPPVDSVEVGTVPEVEPFFPHERQWFRGYINAKETLTGGLPVELKRTVISRMNVRKSCEILS
jgi:hypothetical protein